MPASARPCIGGKIYKFNYWLKHNNVIGDWCVAWQPVEGLQISRMPMIHTRFRFRFVACVRERWYVIFPGNPQFYFHAALVWLLQLCGGITQSNLTTASRCDRIIIFMLPLTTLSSKPIVSEQGRLVESSDDMLGNRQHTRTERKGFAVDAINRKVCESSAWGRHSSSSD